MFGQSAWQNIGTMGSKSYRCGYCGQYVSSDRGYLTVNITPPAFIYTCHHCGKPTFFDQDGSQTPGAIYGAEVKDIDEESVKQLYEEARKCTGNSAYTSAVLSCRKLLMHIAVAKGAKEGLNFIKYVEYLSDKNYIPPDAKDWVDHIRRKGNEANHEIIIMKEEDAKDLLAFLEMLLKIIYEFPANIKRKAITNAPQST